MTDAPLEIREIAEIKSTWKGGNLCCDRYAYGYKPMESSDIALKESAPFLALDETAIQRHTALIRKMLVNDIDNRILRVPFVGQAPELLARLRESRLTDDEALEQLCGEILSGAGHTAGYVVLFYHSVYDIPCRGTDGADQGESDAVYDFITCLICPVKKTKETLAVEGGEIHLTTPDRVIGAPAAGFIWPAFTGRSPDPDSMIIYNADAKDPKYHLFEDILRVRAFLTTAEIRAELEIIVGGYVTSAAKQDYLLKITAALGEKDPEQLIDSREFADVLRVVPEEYRDNILSDFARYIEPYHPTANQLMSPEHVRAVAGKKARTKMQRLLHRAADVIEETKGEKSDLAEELRQAADLQGGEQWAD